MALLIWVFLGLSGRCFDSNKMQPDVYIKSAGKFLSEKKVQTTVIEYRNAVNIDPDISVVLFELAEAYYILSGIKTLTKEQDLIKFNILFIIKIILILLRDEYGRPVPI